MKSKILLWKHPLPKIKYLFSKNSYVYPIWVFIFDTGQDQICSVSYTAKQTVQSFEAVVKLQRLQFTRKGKNKSRDTKVIAREVSYAKSRQFSNRRSSSLEFGRYWHNEFESKATVMQIMQRCIKRWKGLAKDDAVFAGGARHYFCKKRLKFWM